MANEFEPVFLFSADFDTHWLPVPFEVQLNMLILNLKPPTGLDLITSRKAPYSHLSLPNTKQWSPDKDSILCGGKLISMKSRGFFYSSRCMECSSSGIPKAIMKATYSGS